MAPKQISLKRSRASSVGTADTPPATATVTATTPSAVSSAITPPPVAATAAASGLASERSSKQARTSDRSSATSSSSSSSSSSRSTSRSERDPDYGADTWNASKNPAASSSSSSSSSKSASSSSSSRSTSSSSSSSSSSSNRKGRSPATVVSAAIVVRRSPHAASAEDGELHDDEREPERDRRDDRDHRRGGGNGSGSGSRSSSGSSKSSSATSAKRSADTRSPAASASIVVTVRHGSDGRGTGEGAALRKTDIATREMPRLTGVSRRPGDENVTEYLDGTYVASPGDSDDDDSRRYSKKQQTMRHNNGKNNGTAAADATPPASSSSSAASKDSKSSDTAASAPAASGSAAARSAASSASASSAASSSSATTAVAVDEYDDTSKIDAIVHRAELNGSRQVTEYERMNTIDEGMYGVVHRARSKDTGEVVALKRIKMDMGFGVFPITSLREINILLSMNHPNVVNLKEIVVGKSLDEIYMVMEYMEHDLKALMRSMKQPFRQAEVKCLLKQLLSATDAMHQYWILHRDLKTSNLLMNNKGILKVCDFGLARRYSDPIGNYTVPVVTLWYRAPELLLGSKTYGPAIDMWSVGCIFLELLKKDNPLQGKTEFEQLEKIFRLLGTPKVAEWPEFPQLPNCRRFDFLKKQFPSKLRDQLPRQSFSGAPYLSDVGLDLLSRMLTYNPAKRITAAAALEHPYFDETPRAQDPAWMPTFPSGNEGRRKPRDGEDDSGEALRVKRESEAGGFFLA